MKHTLSYLSSRLWVQLLVWGVFAFSVGAGLGFSTLSHGSVACQLFGPTSTFPDGYGMPFNVFSEAKELLLSASCENTYATAEVGSGAATDYVYQYGYEWRDGAWKQVTFTGKNLLGGAWYPGKATVRLNRTQTEMSSSNYFVAYVCQYIDSTWKCGCRDKACKNGFWQLQGFTKPLTTASALPASLLGQGADLVIAGLSTHYGPPGTKVTITGAQFAKTPTNTIQFGSRKMEKVASKDGMSLELTIPADMPRGKHDITVINDKGTSKNSSFFMVTWPGVEPPKVTGISPTSGSHGTQITLRGTGFEPQNNYIITSFGTVSGVSSPDRTTLTFTYKPFPSTPEWHNGNTNEALKKTFDSYFYVMNENGISTTPVKFGIRI